MRGRFGRRRRREDGPRASIDPTWLERIASRDLVSAESLERITWNDLPDSFALVGGGSTPDGGRVLVAVSPRSGGDALLAALVAAARESTGGARIAAVSPRWDAVSRRRLAWVSAPRESIRAVIAGEDAGVPVVEGEPVPPRLMTAAQVAAGVASPGARGLFRRAAGALAGLAAKHGGAVRVAGDGLELVIFARSLAALRAVGDRIVLDSLLPARSSVTLSDVVLPDALDRLEGLVRKRLNDREVRDGEEGLRGRVLGALAGAAGLRDAVRWPGAGGMEAIDLAAVAADGSPALGAVRERISLPVLAEILDAAGSLEPLLPVILADAGAPLLLMQRPRLVLAFREMDPACMDALGQLALEVTGFEISGEEDRLRARQLGAGEAPPAVVEPRPLDIAEESAPAAADEVAGPREGTGRGRRRRRRGRRRPGPREEGSAAELSGEGAELETEEEEAAEAAPPGRRFEEVSLFDLDEEPPGGEGAPSRRRRRRGRGRGRGRRGEGSSAEEGEGDAEDEGERASSDRRAASKGRGPRKGGPPGHPVETVAVTDLEEDDEELLQLSPDAPDVEELEVPAYEDEDEEEPESELDRIRLERERRRRARNATLGVAPAVQADEAGPLRDLGSEELVLPRGRAAILAHADRDAIAATLLLARELRQVEGIWVYPQEELMTFFRSVAVDLREGVPIYVIGFTAKPARDAIQAASLYQGRLVWFDHHDWAPEDLGALREALGPAFAQISPESGSALALVLSACARRSRFSDKLVDLVTGRFTAHDFERWGRLWWWRLGELVKRPGERRADLDALLTGRPSDLAREARSVPAPPPPEELDFISSRDFRLVHFGGLGLVVVEAPGHLDLHLASRIARERYGVTLSLSRSDEQEVLVLAGDDLSGRRSIDVGAMVEHLAQKFGWCAALGDADHVARVRVHELASHPERIDEVIAEIGMGRSILEG